MRRFTLLAAPLRRPRTWALAFGTAAALAATACSDSTPTAPQVAESPAAAKTRTPNTGPLTIQVAPTVLTGSDGLTHTVAGTIFITRLNYVQGTNSLTASGRFVGTVDGVAHTTTFTGAPIDFSRTDPSALAAGITPQQFGEDEPGVCDILFLDLGPIHLNLLGLVLDVAPIQIDLDAQPGAGNLLGNLLCALLGLLDGPALLSSIIQVLDQINAILGALGG